MTATLAAHSDHISVCIDGKLGYEIWQTLRDARNLAVSSRLPLCFDIRGCNQADMAGMGAVMIAQEKVPSVELTGCPTEFIRYFEAFGICTHCSSRNGAATPCPKSGRN